MELISQESKELEVSFNIFLPNTMKMIDGRMKDKNLQQRLRTESGDRNGVHDLPKSLEKLAILQSRLSPAPTSLAFGTTALFRPALALQSSELQPCNVLSILFPRAVVFSPVNKTSISFIGKNLLEEVQKSF